MVGKALFAGVIILAAAGGAGFGYLKNNPQKATALWDSATDMGSGLTFSGGSNTPYVKSKYYQRCFIDFSAMLKRMNKAEKTSACECYDRNISSWSEDMQKASVLAINSLSTMSMVQDLSTNNYKHEKRAKYLGGESAHAENVRRSQVKHQAAENMERLKNSTLGSGDVKQVSEVNSFQIALAGRKLNGLLTQCKIAPKVSRSEVDKFLRGG